MDLRRHRTVTLDYPHPWSQLKPVPSHGGWPASQARRRRHAMNITDELRRALQVNSCANTAADAARDVSGQVLGTMMSEIYLLRSPRPIRSLHGAVGWTPEAIAEHTLPALILIIPRVQRRSGEETDLIQIGA